MPTAGKAVFTSAGCVGCHTLADAGATGTVGPNLDEAKPDTELVVTRVTKGRARCPRSAASSTDQQIADVAAYVTQVDRRLILPPSFPRDVQAFACDFDRTLVGRDALLRPRTRAAIARSQAAGIPVIVATGRMFRSVRPYLEEAGITEPVVCYQGAAVVDPRERHVPAPRADPARDRPRGDRAPRRRSGTRRTATSTTASTSTEHTEYSRMYAGVPAPPRRGGRRPHGLARAAADEARRRRRPGRDPGAAGGARRRRSATASS